jgi:hypothetical protein
MALKPIPKAILILAVVAGAGYGLNFGLSAVKTTPVPVAVVETPQPAHASPKPTEPTEPVVVATPAVSTGDASTDRGLNQLLQQGKR